MTNKLYTGDNLYILNGMNSDSVDLIYLDPPFNSKRTWSAPISSKAAGASFKDIWTWHDVDEECLSDLNEYSALVEYIHSIEKIHSKGMMSYITYMAQRIIQMHRVLRDTGSLYLHVDPTASHYLKIVLDQIFGEKNFINEIIWCYKSGGASKRKFSKKHDTILFYSKSAAFQFYSVKQKSYMGLGYTTGNKNITLFDDGDGLGPYTMVFPKDWWEIGMLATSARERTGYPTQKPLALLHRIIEASSKQGDVVLDPFCGCATTCVAAQQLQRQWIGIDIEPHAVDLLVQRLSGKSDTGDKDMLFSNFIHTDKIPQRTDIKYKKPSEKIKDELYKVQKGFCAGCGKKFDAVNLEIDHIIPKSKGGGSYYENFHLFCGNCNRLKGNRPMEYFVKKIKKGEEDIKKVLH